MVTAVAGQLRIILKHLLALLGVRVPGSTGQSSEARKEIKDAPRDATKNACLPFVRTAAASIYIHVNGGR